MFFYDVQAYSTESSKYYGRMQKAVVRGLDLPAARLAGHHSDAASELCLLFQVIFREDGHAHRRIFAKRRC